MQHRLDFEGNLWWHGAYANWIEVMGASPLGWLLPIPAYPNKDNGLDYTPNPRFSPQGVLLPRHQWPEHLR